MQKRSNWNTFKLLISLLFLLAKNFRLVTLVMYYQSKRSKYFGISRCQFINGYSNSPEYYKWDYYIKKSNEYNQKFDKIIECWQKEKGLIDK